MSASMSLLCGGVMLLAASFVTGSARSFHPSAVTPVSAFALGYLIVFGALTFAGYTWLLTRWPPVLVATHAYTNPVIAVLLGAVIAGERVTPRVLVATVAILGAILLVRHDTRPAAEVIEAA
jgi:drug/metabolite transporter (DMT)-like permease